MNRILSSGTGRGQVPIRQSVRSVAQTCWRQAPAIGQLLSVPKRLVFVILAAMLAYATQFILQHSNAAPDLDVSRRIGKSPQPITGVPAMPKLQAY